MRMEDNNSPTKTQANVVEGKAGTFRIVLEDGTMSYAEGSVSENLKQ